MHWMGVDEVATQRAAARRWCASLLFFSLALSFAWAVGTPVVAPMAGSLFFVVTS